MRKQTTFILALALGLLTTAWGQDLHPKASLTDVTAEALEYFQKIQERSFDNYLKRIRPARISPTLKAELIAALPREGEVEPSARQRAQLAALAPILQYHDRGQTIEFKVIRADQVFIGFYGRSVVLLTEKALDRLSAEELQAVVAHELAHEYFLDEYERARQHQRYREVQELELRCDGIAIITLLHLGRDPERLISAVAQLMPSNQTAMETELLRFYPSLKERTKFTRAMIELAKARWEIEPVLARK